VLLEQSNSRTVETYREIAEVPGSGYIVEPVFGELGPAFKERAQQVGDALKSLDTVKIKDTLVSGGTLHVDVGGEKLEVKPSMFKVSPVLPEGLVAQDFEGGTVIIDVRLDDELLADGVVRELVRHVQDIRRELDLEMDQRVEVYVRGQRELLDMIKSSMGFITEEVRAKRVVLGESGPQNSTGREIEIEGFETLKVEVVAP